MPSLPSIKHGIAKFIVKGHNIMPDGCEVVVLEGSGLSV
jgi:hypothetical protein